MSSGFIQLAAIGQQDVHLTGAPDLTYYASVYKRHTPFVLEAFEVPFDGSAINMGQNNIVRIPVKGDLVRATTLKLTLPPLAEYGEDWFWPYNFSNLPYVNIDYNPYYVNPSFASQYFSSTPANFQQWAGSVPGMTYDPNLNKFIFRNVSIQILFNGSDGVFWGFDPKNPSYKDDYGNLFYTPDVNGVVTPDFTLEQCGWTRSIGRPVNTLSSLFLSRNGPVDIGYVDFTAKIGLNSVWTNEDSPGVFTITPTGITFTNPGTYVLRTDCPSISVEIDNQLFPSISSTVPFIVYNSTQVLSLYIYSDITYVYIEPIDFYAGPLIGNGYSPTEGVMNTNGTPFDFFRISNYGAAIQPDGINYPSFTFSQVGQYLISCNFQRIAGSNLISNVTLYNESTAIDNYKWINTIPGNLSTGEFFLPVTVSNAANVYSLYISSTPGTDIDINFWSFVTVTYLGLPTGGTALYPNGGYILPFNGILVNSDKNVSFTSPVNFINFTKNGVQNMISFGSNVTFSNVGTYMCTSYIELYTGNFISLTFSNTQYNYSLTSSTRQTPIRVDRAPMTLTVRVNHSKFPTVYTYNTYFHFSPLTSSVTPPDYSQYHYYDSVGTWAIETADLKVGGQTIESLTGESIEIWNDLNVPYENQPGLKLLTGKYDMTIATGRDYYINLPFYFYEKSGSYLPISIIDRQDVEIWVTFRPLQALTATRTAPNQVQASLIVEYVYLAQPEITWLSRTNLDYMIEQYQYRDIQLAHGFTHGIFELNFENPIKELFFVIQVDGSLPYDWSNDGLVNLGLTINGEELMTTRITDPTQLGVLEPMENFINFPTRNFYMKTFKSPINFSRLRHVGLDLNVSRADGYYPAKTLRVVAVNMNAMRVANGLAGLMFISQ